MSQKNKQIITVGGLTVQNGPIIIDGTPIQTEKIITSGNWDVGDAGERSVFIAKEPWTIIGVSAVSSTASGSSTADFTLEKNGTDAILSAAIDLDAGANNTVIDGTLTGTPANLSLVADDTIQVTLTGGATSMIGAAIIIRLERALDVNP